jgi:ribose 5-phosphate isomerase B
MTKGRKPTIYLATDHAAYKLKEELRAYLTRTGYKVTDMGAFDDKPSDYPDFIIPAAEAIAASRGKAVGIVLGGSGIGECIAANKVKGVRAALVYDNYSAKMSREHNDANVLCLGSRTASGRSAKAKSLVKIWLNTSFTKQARHKRRIEKISKYEKRSTPSKGSHPSLGKACTHLK